MHLSHPSLSMNGKRKGIKKFRNADEARRARELDESWKQLQKKWQPTVKSTGVQNKIPTLNYRGKDANKPASIDTGHKGAVTVKAIPRYTGTKLIGIGVMHKSNLVPIFSETEAKDISTMRRG